MDTSPDKSGATYCFDSGIHIINYIKTRPLKPRIFADIGAEKDMGAKFKSLLHYSSSKWLSRGKVFKRAYNLRHEMVIFFNKEGHKNAEESYKVFLMKLSYLVNIFDKLNSLNLQLKGNNTNIFYLSEMINAFAENTVIK